MLQKLLSLKNKNTATKLLLLDSEYLDMLKSTFLEIIVSLY